MIFAAYIVHYRALPKKLQSESDRYLSVDAVLWRAVRYSLPELLTRFLHTYLAATCHNQAMFRKVDGEKVLSLHVKSVDTLIVPITATIII